jgi:SUMO ligase MMS21 Smc5/6 complex component
LHFTDYQQITKILLRRSSQKAEIKSEKHKIKKKFDVVFDKTTGMSFQIDSLAGKKVWKDCFIMYAAKASRRTLFLETEKNSSWG